MARRRPVNAGEAKLEETEKISRACVAELRSLGYGDRFIKVYFARLVRHQFGDKPFSQIETVTELLKECASPAVEYVLSTIWGGDRTCNYLAQHKPLEKGQAYLDVGCGFGGSLVAAERRGLDATGIELDKERAIAAEALLADNGFASPVLQMNVFDEGFAALGKFDWVVSVNVVEHVADVRRFLAALASALAPHGTLYLEIPNRHCLQLVNSDPHYGLPFLTLVDHHEALALFSSIPSADRYGMGYEVGDYHDAAFYSGQAMELGLAATVKRDLQTYLSFERSHDLFRSVADKAARLDELYPSIDNHLREKLRQVVWKYLAVAAHAIARRHTGDLSEIDQIRFFSPSFQFFADARLQHGEPTAPFARPAS